MDGKTTLYISALAIVLAIAGIGLNLLTPGAPGPAGATGATGQAGPAGPAGAVGAAGAQGVSYGESAQPETCSICHKTAGSNHQVTYDELYQDNALEVTNLAYAFSTSPRDTITMTFKMTLNGAPFDARNADSLAISFVPYTGTSFEAAARLSLKGTLTYGGAGGITSTLVEKLPTESGYVDITNVGTTPGLIVVYGRDETIGTIPNSRVTQNKYPFAALLETGAGVNYVSAADVAGCEKCHTVPYLKHGYIYGQVNNDATTDFYTCKACHLDNGDGGHYEWQLLVDDPPLAASYLAGTATLTADQKAQYAYKTTLMNDVHMSHSMEFPYPQSMSSCVTCHEGKLDTILADANFKASTCKSCHPVTGSAETGTDVLALTNILPSPLHDGMNLDTANCIACHSTGNGFNAPTFSQIHSGYDKAIYTAAGQRYSDAIKVTIDSATVANNKLTIKFSATESPDIAGIGVTDIKPTVLVGLYGYDTHDFLIGPHEKLVDSSRNLEFVVGSTHPRMTTVSAAGGSWEVTADLSAWASLISDGTVKRVEIGIIPTLNNTIILALDAPSRTFELASNAFDDSFYSPIVKVSNGCENCHDALATNYHSPDRGGNIIICGLCHTVKSGGSHLEMASRSIDSYVHAIHSGQAFDISSINFADPVAALEYEEHIGFPYPTHGIADCESCHVTGTYEVPDQSKSLPGLLSASAATLEGKDRSIGTIPAYVTGPASLSCGGCHRAALINEDAAGGLASLNQHIKQGGYLVEGGSNSAATLNTAITDIMAIYK